MLEFLGTPLARAVIYGTVLLVLIVIGYYVVRRFRDQSDEDRLTASEMMTNFREMYRDGMITDKEFRTIKTRLGEKLQQQLDEQESKETSGEG